MNPLHYGFNVSEKQRFGVELSQFWYRRAVMTRIEYCPYLTHSRSLYCSNDCVTLWNHLATDYYWVPYISWAYCYRPFPWLITALASMCVLINKRLSRGLWEMSCQSDSCDRVHSCVLGSYRTIDDYSCVLGFDRSIDDSVPLVSADPLAKFLTNISDAYNSW